MAERSIVVCGLPGAQGSKRFVGISKAGRGILIESSKKVAPWREAVKWAALQPWPHHCITGPVYVGITFTLPRPKSAPKSRIYPDGAPDLDKLCRAVFDSLTQAGAIEDDSRVVRSSLKKLYVGHADALPHPGAVIHISSMERE